MKCHSSVNVRMLWERKPGEPNPAQPSGRLSSFNPFVAQLYLISCLLIPNEILLYPFQDKVFFSLEAAHWTSDTFCLPPFCSVVVLGSILSLSAGRGGVCVGGAHNLPWVSQNPFVETDRRTDCLCCYEILSTKGLTRLELLRPFLPPFRGGLAKHEDNTEDSRAKRHRNG